MAARMSATFPSCSAEVLMDWLELHISVSWFTPGLEGNKQGSYKEEGGIRKSPHPFNNSYMPGPLLSSKRHHSCSAEFTSRWRFGRASVSRNNPQAGPSSSNGERGGPSRKVWGYIESGSPETGPELKIFIKVAYQEMLPRETYSGVGQRRGSDKGPISSSPLMVSLAPS